MWPSSRINSTEASSAQKRCQCSPYLSHTLLTQADSLSWESTYATELTNNTSNPSDIGMVWFSDSNAEEKILSYLETLTIKPGTGDRNNTPAAAERTDIRILDLGTGNGHLLFALRDAGWKAEMVGVDYSVKSVELASQIQRSRYLGEDIHFVEWDIFEETAPGKWPWGGEVFDIVLDKGTFDAVGFMDGEEDRCKLYARVACSLVKEGGYLLVTSCNWTEGELKWWFDVEGLQYYDTIRSRKFTFGGVEGQTISSVCFKRLSMFEDENL